MLTSLRRASVAAVLLAAALSFACRPSTVLPGEQKVSASSPLPARVTDSGDTTAPDRVVIDNVEVKLNAGACPNIDVLRLRVTAFDNKTASASLRYIASFGSTTAEADAADPVLLFDTTSATHIDIPLLGEAEAHFGGPPRCFTLSAVDDAANVGPKSEARCVDTSKPTGCSSAPALLVPLGLLLARRRRHRR